jgi:glycogen synthase
MPSHFEGLPNSLLEAMAYSCVPVAFCVPGVTDWVIEHGVSGFVCPMGDTRSMAGYIEALARDAVLRARMAAAARARIATRFTASQMARDFHSLFLEVLQAAEPQRPDPKPWGEFRLESAYRPTWRRFVPTPAKIMARRLGLIQ